ncbi:acetyltransferase, family [Aquipluma nitroreducens]|uniref:Acetyltransferase, family n=1 Tax=Aquipluma nitroreducens TaxID=2010828 RepID=A0A5K7S5B8_9BACT|nr:GNAT family N-acetyltransferase [Aquipluma nitroreducens]BBE16680.1 acetyltransferase, family [Aquipluma nitroreducens]
MKIEIIELSHRMNLLLDGITYFWNCWGNDSNYKFYKNCIENSLNDKNSLPKFYLALLENEIVGSYALLTNDIISRQDLMPWFACLFVNEEQRNKGIAEQLLQHGLTEAYKKDLKSFICQHISIPFTKTRDGNTLQMVTM